MTNIVEVTVKTLDSQNHQFSVPDDMTIQDFKVEISPRIGIPIEQQRLIFRGRVLQDEKKLSECNVANNTVHVVIRPANASSNRNNDEPSRVNNERGNSEGGQGGIIITGDSAVGGGRNAIIMGAIGLPTNIDIQGDAGMQHSVGSRSRNSAAFRLQVGNQMLGRASSLLRRLEVDDTIASAAAAAEATLSAEDNNSGAQNQQTENNGGNSPMDIDLDDQNSFGRMISQVASAATTAALVASIRQVPTGAGGNVNASSETLGAGQQPVGADGNATSNTTAPGRPEAPRLREMAIVVQDILAFQERLAPYLQFIQSALRTNRLYETEELQSTQYVFDTVSSILHYMGHSYHALSDIMCDFITPPETRRLWAAASVLVEQSSVIRATIPMAVSSSMLSGNQPNSIPTNTSTPQNPNATATGATTAPGQPETNAGNGGPIPGVPQFNFGGTGQPQINFGMVGQPQVNFGVPGQHQINFGGMGQPQMSFTGTGQGGFSIPDLSALLGPAMAGGMMPMFMQANASQAGRPTSTATTANTPNNQSSPSTTPATTTPNVTARPQTGFNNNNGLAGNVMGNLGMLNNLPMQLRNEIYRPPFDILLNCHSHHGTRTQSNRPTNLRQFVNVGETNRVNHGSSEDFLLTCADLIRQSNILNILQPMLHDVITNYLMRGRDVKNADHIRSCGRSWAKKLTPFLESFTEKVSKRNEKVVYSETYCNLITRFFTEILQSTLNNPAGTQYKAEVIRACEKFLGELMAVFNVCFSKRDGYLPLFVKAVVDKLFGGTSLIFRENAAKNLTEYFSSFVGSDSIDCKIVYTDKEDKNEVPVLQTQGQPTVATVPVNNSPGIIGSTRVAGVLPPKQARQNPGPSSGVNSISGQRSMEEDIDDMLNLTAPRRPMTQMLVETNNYETALRNIPSEWIDTVRHDLHRQLGMPEQPPFSPGYIALLSRKP